MGAWLSVANIFFWSLTGMFECYVYPTNTVHVQDLATVHDKWSGIFL